MARYLRFAGVVVFAILTVALIGLWVRSYYREDSLWGSSSRTNGFRIMSELGRVTTTLFYQRPMFDPWPSLIVTSFPHTLDDIELRRRATGLGFDYSRDPFYFALTAPHWFLVVVSATLAAALAFKRHWRFSLRTILIATTLLAGVLGLAVYSV